MPPELLPVPFSGARSGSGPLTFGQRNTLNWVDTDPASAVLHWVFTLPAAVTLADVTAALAVLLARHEALRTRFPSDTQEVLGSGTLLVEVHRDGADADSLVATLRSRGVDFRTGLPLRVAVAVDGDTVAAVVAVYSHMAVDFGSMALIGRQFTELVGSPAAHVVGEPGHQPLDQAAVERSPRGSRAAEAALRYWESLLRTAPQAVYPVPPPARPGTGLRICVLESPAAGVALGTVSARTKSSPQVVLLAAVCAVLGWRTGTSRCVFASVSGNRFRLRLREYVGSLAQDGLLALDVDASSFDELVARAARATLAANTHSMFDAPRLWRIIDEVGHDRGTAFTRDFSLNDLSSHLPFPEPSVDAAGDATGPTVVRWTESADFPVVMMCNPAKLAPELMLALTVDLRHVGEAETELLLRGVERLLVAAAAENVPLARLGEVTGVPPVVRDADWVCVDSNWVRLSAVRRLVTDAVGPSRVVATRTGLVAYLSGTSPVEAHAACMTRLPGRHLAMAPTHYVVCAGVPDDVDSMRQWRALPVVAEGDGRIKHSA
ncbi:MAG TPA: condensation domain-containing protein [Pseudonocardiaceae bacterium]|nr:condensation domain-containing protein [Pseudonocardiaceae bacterium]